MLAEVERLADEMVDFTRALVRIPTVNPPGEAYAACAELVRSKLREVGYADVADRIPPLARALPGPVYRCATCDRVYWRGSHARRMERILEEVFPQH